VQRSKPLVIGHIGFLPRPASRLAAVALPSGRLAVLGGLVGVVVAYWSKDLLTLLLARDFDLRIDWRALAFTGAISLSTGLLVGLVPALQASGFAVRKKTARQHLNRTSLVIQVAMSVVLMIGAGLLLRTLGKLPHDDPGFAADNLLIFRVDAPNAYDAERIGALYEQILERVASLPGVESATYSSAPLISTGSYWGNIVRPVDGGLESSAVVRELGVHPSFFSVTGLSVSRGRELNADDRLGAPIAVVLSDNAARKLFGEADPIGRRALLGGLAARWIEVDVVGIVPDVGLATLGDDNDGSLFVSSAQVPALGPSMDNASFSVRVSGKSAALVPALHETVRALDPDLPVFGMTTQMQLLDERVGAVYRVALTWTLLGGLAVVLTSIGLYGLIAYSAARRTNEIGVRLALGARPLHVIRLVMGQSLLLVGLGIAVGAIASLLVSQTIRVFVFGVTLYDPVTLLVVILAILGVTALAGYLPARRASSVDPCIALRYE
jgi:predicted permease